MKKIMNDIMKLYLIKKVPFKISLINNDNWNNSLPENIKQEDFLNLEINGIYLKNAIIENDNITLKININKQEYIKTIKPEEILALLTIENIPIAFNHFIDI